QDVSDKLLGQFIACIEKHLAGGQATPPPAAGEELVSEPTVAKATVPQATVQDTAEAARPEVVTEPVPSAVHDAGEPPSLAEEVDRSKTAAAAAAASRRPSPAVEAEDDALDLGSAVLPVLIQ